MSLDEKIAKAKLLFNMQMVERQKKDGEESKRVHIGSGDSDSSKSGSESKESKSEAS